MPQARKDAFKGSVCSLKTGFYLRKGLIYILTSISNTLYLNRRPECVWLFWTIMLCSLRRTINLFTALGERVNHILFFVPSNFVKLAPILSSVFWMQVSRQLIWSVRVHRIYNRKEGCIREIINYVMVDISWTNFLIH